MSKKNEEINFGKFFSERLCIKWNLDYTVVPNDDESGEEGYVDLFMLSEKHSSLKIQVVTYERVRKEISANLSKESRLTGKGFVMGPVINVDTVSWIKEAIERKEKKYSKEVKAELVLLVTGDRGSLLNEDYARNAFKGLEASLFKGIYYVRTPADTTTSSHPNSGQIIAIKDIFGNHGSSL